MPRLFQSDETKFPCFLDGFDADQHRRTARGYSLRRCDPK